MNQLMTIVAQFGMVLGALGYLALIYVTPGRARRSRMIGSVVIGAMALGILGALAGVLWRHPRPLGGLFSAAPENAFPSWPVAIAALFAMLLFWRHRNYGIAAGFIALIVGGARVFAKVETYVDVLAGLVLGVAAGLVGIIIFAVIWHRLYLAAAAKLAEETENQAQVTESTTEA